MLQLSPKKVLLIKPSAIGDVVHALPILALMRRAWPDAHIAWLVTPACSGLLENHPLLSEVILFDRKRYGTALKSTSAARAFRDFTRSLRSRHFDLVVDLQGLFRSGYLAWQTRAPHRVGFAKAREGAPLFYTHRVPASAGALDTLHRDRHAIDRYLDVAEYLGLGRGPLEYPFNTTDTHRARADALLSPLVKTASPATPRFAVLIPGTNWPTKRWPAEHFRSLAVMLREHLQLPSVVIGAGSDRELAAVIAPDLDLTGTSSLSETTALLERATVVIANDTGPMHIAAALGVPLVTPYGPTSPVRTGPYRRQLSVLQLDIPCSPCLSRTCSHTTCMQELKVETVFAKVIEQLALSTAAAALA